MKIGSNSFSVLAKLFNPGINNNLEKVVSHNKNPSESSSKLPSLLSRCMRATFDCINTSEQEGSNLESNVSSWNDASGTPTGLVDCCVEIEHGNYRLTKEEEGDDTGSTYSSINYSSKNGTTLDLSEGLISPEEFDINSGGDVYESEIDSIPPTPKYPAPSPPCLTE